MSTERDEEQLLVAVTEAVEASIKGSWKMAKEIFGENAKPEHAIEISRLVGDRFMDALEMEDEEDEEDEEEEERPRKGRRG